MTGLVELTCSTCKLTKPVAEFGVQRTKASGRRGQCKACRRDRVQRQEDTFVLVERAPAEADARPLLPVASWLVEREEWQEQARCRGKTDMMFPAKSGNFDAPKQLCRSCPVQFQCLEYALRTKQHLGVWGGTTERQRKAIRSRRRKQQQVAS